MEKKNDVGVIVARFQVPSLTDGHKDLIQQVVDSNYKVIIVLGLSSVKCSIRNPLDFEARKQMILEEFPDANILYIKDTYSDKNWSITLDALIKDIVGPNDKILLYGSRDSFIKYYSGKFNCIELEQKVFISGTDVRKVVSRQVKKSPDFRKGVIWAVGNQYSKCLPTVDACIYKHTPDKISILLGKRNTEPFYRFIGGFVPSGETYEQTIIREVKEESNLIIDNPKYLNSYMIDDWRYKQETDKITTIMFMVGYNGGIPEPGDDIDELRFFDISDNEYIMSFVVDEHKDMMSDALKWFDKMEI